jgi:hypothetical protein
MITENIGHYLTAAVICEIVLQERRDDQFDPNG